MELRPRHRRAGAVVGLLAALALLLGAVVDGGISTPTRTDVVAAAAAVPHGDVAATSAQPREDHPAWAASLLPSPIVLLVAAGMTAASIALAPPPDGPCTRAPARRAARHRGPPVLV